MKEQKNAGALRNPRSSGVFLFQIERQPGRRNFPARGGRKALPRRRGGVFLPGLSPKTGDHCPFFRLSLALAADSAPGVTGLSAGSSRRARTTALSPNRLRRASAARSSF